MTVRICCAIRGRGLGAEQLPWIALGATSTTVEVVQGLVTTHGGRLISIRQDKQPYDQVYIHSERGVSKLHCLASDSLFDAAAQCGFPTPKSDAPIVRPRAPSSQQTSSMAGKATPTSQIAQL
jgi:hypothetical protein